MDFIKKESGLSFVELLISIAILGVALTVYIKSTSMQVMDTKKSVDKLNLAEMQQAVSNDIKGAVLNTKNLNGQKIEGFCSMIEVEKGGLPPLAAVYVNLNKMPNAFSKERINGILSKLGWEEVSLKDCSESNFKYCYKLNKSFTHNQKLTSLSPVLEINITPVFLNPQDGDLFKPIPTSEKNKIFDAKTIGFSFFSKMKYVENGTPKEMKQESFEWSGFVGNCDYKINGNSYVVSITGMESTPEDGVIYNRPGFDSNKENPVTVIFPNNVIQEGLLDKNSNFITTDSTKNIASSCVEMNFRCRNQNSNTREYVGMGLDASILYQTPNRLTNAQAINLEIDYKINNGSERETNVKPYYSSVINQDSQPDDCKNSVFNPNINPKCYSDKTYSIKNLQSKVNVSMNLTDSSSTTSASNVCRKICSSNTNYNTVTEGGSLAKFWVASLGIKFKDFNIEEDYKAGDRISCTACYMKNCDQAGLGTFGPMEKIPYQPKDASIPECVQYDPKEIIYTQKGYSDVALNLGTGDCVAGYYQGGKINFEKKNCSEKLPAACFAFGQFSLTKKLSKTTSSFDFFVFDQAARKCFEMGKEITNKAKLNAQLQVANTDIPSDGVNYNFINLAQQGIFLAPQTQGDFESLAANTAISPGQRFWVGINANSTAHYGIAALFAVPPMVQANTNEAHGIFYDGQGALKVQSDKTDTKKSTSTNLGYGVLSHTMKMKGIRFLDGNNPLGDSTEMLFLCRKKYYPYDLFLSNQKSIRFSDGLSACSDTGGEFLPPVTSSEWVQALLLVNKNHANHGFPSGNTLVKKGIWVALVGPKNDNIGVNAKVSPDSLGALDYLGIGTYSPSMSDHYYVMNEKGVFVDPKMRLEINVPATGVTIPKNGKFSIIINDVVREVRGSSLESKKYSQAELKILIGNTLASDGVTLSEATDKIIVETYSTNLTFSAGDTSIVSSGGKTLKTPCLKNGRIFSSCSKDDFKNSPLRINSLGHKLAAAYWKLIFASSGNGYYRIEK